MQHLGKLLATSGLVLMAGPLSLLVQAQPGYVDVEAERAAAEVAARSSGDASGDSSSSDPYGPRQAQSYPATSFGVGGTPAPAAVTAPVAPTSGQAGAANLGNLFYQLQQLQQEVMQLNGKVEEQAYQIRRLEEQSMQRYMDLDKRLAGGVAEGATGALATGAATGAGSSSAGSAVQVIPTAPAATGGVELPGEADAYRAAYALVQGRQFDNAVPAFQQFLQAYPTGKYAANAHYWLGELYLVVQPRNLESARQSFALLLSEYPEHPKAPDALYKLGKVQFEKGNREKAREYLDLVIRQYQSANPDVARLAREFINENY